MAVLELLWNYSSGLAINVDTDNGVVSLSGTVDSDDEKELAARIAENTEGAKSVVNQLTVEQAG
ncbi:MAG: BON domain-containing protein [Gammaproteobacteria bacterium]